MPQISTGEFERLPLRVHDSLAGVRLHDVLADGVKVRVDNLQTLHQIVLAPEAAAQRTEMKQ